MGKQRTRWDTRDREQARDLYVHKRMSVRDISETLGIPIGTLGKWQAQDSWVDDLESTEQESFAQTCDYLMRTIHRMTLRLFQSTIPSDAGEDFTLPDENLELRINRLTLALERVMPMGNLLHAKHRIDVIKEIKQHGFNAVAQGVFTNDDMMIAFRVIEHFLDSLDLSKSAAQKIA